MPAGLKNSDIRDVLELGRRVLECREPDELRLNALELLEKDFHCDSANFFLTQARGGKLDLAGVITRGVTAENLAGFRDYYFRFDPFLRHFPPPAPILTMDQVSPPDRLLQSEYYNDFLRPQAIHHQLTMAVRSEGRVAGVVALFRSRKRRNFSQTEIIKADLCLAYLSGALEKVMLTDRAFKRHRAAEALASGLPCRGVAVADRSLEVIFFNHGAEKAFGPAGDENAMALPPEVTRACREILAGEREGGLRFLLNRDSRAQPVEVGVRLINHPEAGPLFLISCGSDQASGNWMNKLAARGVSRREMEVVHLVLQGLTNAEISRRLYISLHTVENHLKAIFRKLGVKNRASLIGALAGISGELVL
ncbi:MAG: helix-turn-helix transcriptional regulator [Pseudomonadota bacterium]